MPTSFTTNLRLSNPGLGDTGWGATVSNGMIDLVDPAISGTTSVSVTAGNVTLTSLNGVADQARQMFLVATGTPGVPRDVIVPSTSKLYFVKNDANDTVTFKVLGQPGVAVPAGSAMALRVNGTDVVVAQDQFVTLKATGNVTFDGGAFVFNESGADKDARFEGDTDANLLFLDASTDRVGIGTSTPVGKIDSVSNATAAFVARASTTGANQTVDALTAYNSDASLYALARYNAVQHIWRYAGTTEGMRLDASGNLGIGVASPAYRVDVSGPSVPFRINSSNNNNVLAISTFGTIGGYLGSNGTNLLFGTSGGSEAMRIDTSGNVGIGTTSPSQKLHVNGAGSTYIRVSSTNASTGSGLFTKNATSEYLIGAGAASGNSNLEFRDVTNAATRMSLTSGGNLGIGTTTVNARLHVDGNVAYTIPVSFAGAAGNAAWTTGFGSQSVSASILATDSVIGANIYSVSDERLKSNITPIPENAGLEFVKAVDPVSFDWKADNSHDTGFIAQALMAKGYGHLVSAVPDGAMEEVTHEDGNVSPAGARFVVRYDSIVPILHAAIRDQQALIEALMARVAALEAK